MCSVQSHADEVSLAPNHPFVKRSGSLKKQHSGYDETISNGNEVICRCFSIVPNQEHMSENAAERFGWTSCFQRHLAHPMVVVELNDTQFPLLQSAVGIMLRLIYGFHA